MQDEIRDVHNFPQRLSRAIRHLVKNEAVTNENKLAILRFVAYLHVIEGCSMARQAFYVQRLERLAVLLAKDFVDANEDDVREIVGKLNTMKVRVVSGKGAVVSERPMSGWTREAYKVTLKKFFRYLRKKRKGQTVDETDWIELKKIRTTIKASDLLSPHDILMMLRAKRAQHPRNRALILSTFESGGRPTEILNLRVQDVYFDRYGARLRLCGKKIDGERAAGAIRVVYSAQALANWLSMHPSRDNPDAPVFVSLNSANSLEPLAYDRARLLLRLIAMEAGLKKKVNMYNFRHSILTRMACSKRLSDAELREFGGWSQSTRMFSTYIHVSNEQLDRRILETNHIIPEDEDSALFEQNTCPRCSTVYPPDVGFCSRCGMDLRAKAVVNAEQIQKKADELLNRLFEDPQAQTFLLRKMKQLKLIPLLSELASSAHESSEEKGNQTRP